MPDPLAIVSQLGRDIFLSYAIHLMADILSEICQISRRQMCLILVPCLDQCLMYLFVIKLIVVVVHN
jgi:hypothetical protein